MNRQMTGGNKREKQEGIERKSLKRLKNEGAGKGRKVERKKKRKIKNGLRKEDKKEHMKEGKNIG